jgi:hypothetical protein
MLKKVSRSSAACDSVRLILAATEAGHDGPADGRSEPAFLSATGTDKIARSNRTPKSASLISAHPKRLNLDFGGNCSTQSHRCNNVTAGVRNNMNPNNPNGEPAVTDVSS